MENQNISEEINLVSYINLIIKNRKIIIWTIIAGVLLACLAYFAQTRTKTALPAALPPSSPSYQSESVIEIGSINGQPIEKMDDLVVKVNGSYCSKDSDVTALALSSSLIDLKTVAQSEEQAKDTLSNCVNTILADHIALVKDYTDKTEKIEGELRYSANKLVSQGQQSASLENMIFALENNLATVNNSKLVLSKGTVASSSPQPQPQEQGSTKKILKLIFLILAGITAGFFAGLIIVLVKEWWNKNKANINL